MIEANDPNEPALARAREAALAELRRAPVAVPWRRWAARRAAVVLGAGLLVIAVAVAAGLATPEALAARAGTLLPLLLLGALGAVAAVAPRARAADPLRALVLAAAPLLMAVIVVARGPGLPSTTPAWVCSASHVGIGLLPLGFALAALRESASSWSRALAAGLGAGTLGALLGELACHRSWSHVLVHHVGAWLIIAAACVVLSRLARPRTFAP